MACLTSVYLDWRVFKDERTALVRVASKANGILSGRTAYLLWTHGSMYVVAVAALDQTFVHTMMKGHRKLCFLVEMARVAERGLRLDEKEFLRFRMVRGMTRRAAYVVFRMFRIDGVHVLRATGMASQAALVDLFGRMIFKVENRVLRQRLRCVSVVPMRSLDGCRVRFRRSVAALAAVNVVLAGKRNAPMASHVIAHRLVFVALPAELRSRKISGN